MVRKVSERITGEQLHKDLEKYRLRAIEIGATDAKIITTDMVVIDERVRAKCIYPKCAFYGTNAQCPPHAIDLEQTVKIVKSFQYAIFTKRQGPPERFAGPEVGEKNLGVPELAMTHKIVSKIEGEAFYDGYHLALGFACGPCKRMFCPNKECRALVPGQPCRHPLRARSSMEAVGMDAFKMAVNAGWDIYPIGPSLSPSEVPFGVTLGLVLIH